MISIELTLLLCFLVGMFAWILGYISNSDTDDYDQL